jgi:anti-sigma factor RsiW
MDNDTQLKLQAYLDGELSPDESRRVERLLEEDENAVALLAELESTSKALATYPALVTLPESREFFWSKIQREIQRQETSASRPENQSPLPIWMRWLTPAGAIAALAIVVGLSLSHPPVPLAITTSAGPKVFETASADAEPITYQDDAASTTLVWFSYPSENKSSGRNPASIIQ